MIGGMGDGDTRETATMLGMDVVADATAYQGMNGRVDLSHLMAHQSGCNNRAWWFYNEYRAFNKLLQLPTNQ